MKFYDIIIIGKGLIGSATAKYISNNKIKVAIIGPDEPKNYEKSIVFSSHFDQARIQRIIGRNELSTRLNLNSALEYRNIEEKSDIKFYYNVGCLYVNPYGADEYLSNSLKFKKIFNLTYKSYNNYNQLTNDFKDFRFEKNSIGIYEDKLSGYINPRNLINAQLKLFKKNNGEIFNETVVNLNKKNSLFYLKTFEDNEYVAEKVLISTGAFVNYLNIIPKKIKVKVKSEVILLAKLNKKQAEKLKNLPSLLYEINNGDIDGIYLIQPVLYPDNNFYIKMGASRKEDIFFNTLPEIQDWFIKGESKKFEKEFINAIKNLMPKISFNDFMVKRCVVSYTENNRNYIDELNEKNLFINCGCNGYSAMCSDALGKIGSHFILNKKFPDEYSKFDFSVCYN